MASKMKKTSGKGSASSCCAKPFSADLTKKIQDRAYFIWESKGKPAGRDREFWLQAEKEIKAKCCK